MLEFLKEREVFVKEIAASLYSVYPYFLSKQVIEFPLLLLLPLLENCIMWWCLSFRAGTFWQFALIYTLTMQVGSSLGYMVSSVFSNMETAAIVTVFSIMPSIMFAGLLVNLTTLSVAIRWAQWTSPIRFAFEALLWAQYPNDEYHIQEGLGFDMGYNKCALCLFGWIIIYKVLTMVFLSYLSNSGYK